MSVGLIARAARRGVLEHVRHVRPVRPRDAKGLVEAVYTQVERDFGMLAPPIALHSPAPASLAASWLMLRETLVAAGAAGRAAKEAVATGVSRGNDCPYCVDVHGTFLDGMADNDDDLVLVSWGRSVGTWQGPLRKPPFPVEWLPELGGVAVTFHYLNRMVNVFLRRTLLPRGVPVAVRRLLGRMLRSAARPRRPGESLLLLPPAPSPEDLSWTAGNPAVAGAFARAAAAIGQAGDAVPPAVRRLVHAELERWDGNPPGPSRAWAERAVSRLPAGERAAGRLALLTAIASYQVDEAAVEACGLDDRSLVELTSWTSLTAARHAASWIGAPSTLNTAG